MPQPANSGPPARITAPLTTGVRVSLELPDAGTCVGVVSSTGPASVVLELLDELTGTDLSVGAVLDLFMPRPEGIYHWPCMLISAPAGQSAEVELLSSPVFVQRRLGHRVGAELQAQVRRLRSARRGRPHEMVVLDLSRGGLKLEGPFQLSTGDTLEITVDLGVPVQAVGRAVMAYPTAPGVWTAHVSFLEGQHEVAEAVGSYVAGLVRPLR